ncbi:MAG TPA: CGNR zinc finger domain-containing protein [Jatrophihabitans sp.]|jgi:predicted RNA-binding Zn ribbon-like protein|uniref:CGNR zinc finger domain-containing protein n=1 Tax=Jatrophihabitans sp. TaxID=1932789 RepID=UPI002EE19F20
MAQAEHESAPAQLETVRALLNTWLIPNGTRLPVDQLPGLWRDRRSWRARLPLLGRPPDRAALRSLTEVRDGIRRMVGNGRPDTRDLRWLQAQLRRHPLTVSVRAGPDGPQVVLGGPGRRPARDTVLAAVLDALDSGQWQRLKACPDCGWVFYDHTRSATKRWCGMTAVGPRGRACGSIAKVRAYRARQAGQPAGSRTTSVP